MFCIYFICMDYILLNIILLCSRINIFALALLQNIFSGKMYCKMIVINIFIPSFFFIYVLFISIGIDQLSICMHLLVLEFFTIIYRAIYHVANGWRLHDFQRGGGDIYWMLVRVHICISILKSFCYFMFIILKQHWVVNHHIFCWFSFFFFFSDSCLLFKYFIEVMLTLIALKSVYTLRLYLSIILYYAFLTLF